MDRIRFLTDIHEVFDMYHSSHYYDPDPRCKCSMIEYIKTEFDAEERQEMMKRLERCHCCSRHSHYKKVSKPVDPVPESRKVDDCMCNCRHWYRILSAL